ncbi:hypothetical protein T439DRAFT_360532 [Meredithblackwellia eburnea MCA 4105]
MFFRAQQAQQPPSYETIISHTTFLPPPSYLAHVLDVVVVETNATLEPRRDYQRDEKTWLKNGSNRLVKHLKAAARFFMPTPTTLAIGIKIYLTIMLFYIMFSLCSLITIDLEESHSFCLKAPRPTFFGMLLWLPRTALSPALEGLHLMKMWSRHDIVLLFLTLVFMVPVAIDLFILLLLEAWAEFLTIVMLVVTLGHKGWWWKIRWEFWVHLWNLYKDECFFPSTRKGIELLDRYLRGAPALVIILFVLRNLFRL